MTNPNDPINIIVTHGFTHLGLTKREYFAGICMSLILSNKIICEDKAEFACRMADALIKELNKEVKDEDK